MQASAVRRTAEATGTVDLDDVLGTIAEFGAASRGLVAWEFSLPESAIAAPWEEAVSQGLVMPIGDCPQTGEPMFVLAVD